MKQILLLLFLFSVAACSKTEIKSSDCEKFIDQDLEELQESYNPHLLQRKGNPTTDDDIGQRENLDQFIDDLNEICSAHDFSLLCYACIQTFPPQSEIKVTLSNDSIFILDILTAADSLKLVGLHE